MKPARWSAPNHARSACTSISRPVADVNNNPRNPVINIRSFGEDPARAGAMVAGWARGLQDAGMLATLKHFPGHGDTDVDSHLGLPVVPHPRERLDAVELAPFRTGIAAGAAGVMVAHIELPAIDPEKQPATFSPKVIGTLLRPGFDGLIYSDSMKMAAITKMASAGEAAVRAVKAGIDVILDSPDSAAAAAAIVAAVKAGDIPRAQVEQSARRILEAKARLGLHRTRTVNLDAAPLSVGGRKHDAVARAISERSITLIKDARNTVPLPTPRTGSVLYLSVLDYPSGWRIAAPSRTVIPALKARWPNTESVEISDRATPSELDLVRAMADNYDAIVAGVFVRASSGSGRLDLAPPVVRLLQDLSRGSERAVATVRRGVLRQSVHADVRAGDSVDDADLRFLRLRGGIGGEGAGWRDRDRRQAADRAARLCFRSATASCVPCADPSGLRPAFASASTSFSHASSLLMQPPHDRGVRRCHDRRARRRPSSTSKSIAARAALEEQLPIAVTHGALIEAGGRHPPEQRARYRLGAGVQQAAAGRCPRASPRREPARPQRRGSSRVRSIVMPTWCRDHAGGHASWPAHDRGHADAALVERELAIEERRIARQPFAAVVVGEDRPACWRPVRACRARRESAPTP